MDPTHTLYNMDNMWQLFRNPGPLRKLHAQEATMGISAGTFNFNPYMMFDTVKYISKIISSHNYFTKIQYMKYNCSSSISIQTISLWNRELIWYLKMKSILLRKHGVSSLNRLIS
jgi:hypothetical protein